MHSAWQKIVHTWPLNRFPVRLFSIIWVRLKGAGRDIAPILVVIAFFQLVVLRQPFPHLGEILWGILLVYLGLIFFLEGLEMGLFPIGERLATGFARKGSFTWLMVFSFALGFSTTIAEPALIAISAEAAEVATEAGFIEQGDESQSRYALGMRLTVAFSVGLAVVLGVLRILFDWPLHWLMAGGYIAVIIITFLAPPEIIGIAYDSGGVTTSTITVPMLAALGIGLASTIRHRNPLLHGFGLIAFASLLPIIFVLLYGIVLFRS